MTNTFSIDDIAVGDAVALVLADNTGYRRDTFKIGDAVSLIPKPQGIAYGIEKMEFPHPTVDGQYGVEGRTAGIVKAISKDFARFPSGLLVLTANHPAQMFTNIQPLNWYVDMGAVSKIEYVTPKRPVVSEAVD